MYKRMLRPGLMMLVFLLSILACGGSVSTANIKEAWLSTDQAGENRVTDFPQDTVFYVQVDLKNAPDDTVVKAVWTAVQAEGVDANFVIDEAELTSGDNLLNFSLSNNNLWPLGSYKVDIYLNGELKQTINFEVK